MNSNQRFRKKTDAIFERFIGGDTDALVAFLDAVRENTIGYFILRGHQFQDIADAIQDAALQLLRKPPKWTAAQGTACGLFFVIVKRSMINNAALKCRGKSVRCFSDLKAAGSDDDRPRDLAISFDAPDDDETKPDDIRTRESLREAVAALTPKQREAVRLHFEECLTIQEIADALGMSWGRVNDRIRMAVKTLQKNPVPRSLRGLDPVDSPPSKRGGNRFALPANELSEKQWDAVRLIHDKGLSQRAAGKALGIGHSTAEYRWKTALKKIAKSSELQSLTGIGPGMYGI